MQRVIYIFLLLSLYICGCRSDADRMAEFCLQFEAATHGSDCEQIAHDLGALLDAPQPALRDAHLCERSTACLPCKRGARDLLRLCGQDPSVRAELDKMHFSTTLRASE